ncbi:MAG: hypothetical protein AMXMBFR44_0440 [Candidatus Campbellbacteria bacterium]
MKRLLITVSALVLALGAIIALKYSPGFAEVLWSASNGGVWLLPLVFFSALLDSVHPCSFSILLITVAFLFGMQLPRKKILQIGGIYIVGIFAAYFAIGIGLLKVLHVFNVPHFMGKLGAGMLIVFGVLNLLGSLFPKFPIKLRIPKAAHASMTKLMGVASLPAAFALGLLVGLCQFPCMGGPYLMVVGLLHDGGAYASGFGYLLLYNLILIAPLVATLIVAANPAFVDKMQEWRKTQMKDVHRWVGIAMIIIGVLIFYL